MNNKIDINQISQELLELYIETKDIEKAVEIFVDKELKKLEGKETLENTLNQFNSYEFKDEQIEVFKELIKYDKSIIYDEDRIFYRLNILLMKIFEHLDSLKVLNKLENEEDFMKRGIAKTSHPVVKDAIIPRIKTLVDYQKLNNSKESKLMVNLYEDFLTNPLEIRAMYQGINQSGLSSFIGEEKELINTVFQQETYLNSATKLEDIHIFRSCQLYSLSFYKEDNPTNKSLQLDINIQDKELLKYIDILMDSFFEYEFESNLNASHLKKEIQLKDTFNNLGILEFRTKRNKKEHPIFKDL